MYADSVSEALEVVLPRIYYLQNSIIGLVLVTIMLHYVLGEKGKRQKQDSLFALLLLCAMILLIVKMGIDLFSGTIFPWSRILLSFMAFLFCLLSPLPGVFYFLYVYQLDKGWERIPNNIWLLGSIPFLLNALFTILSLFNGMLFSIDATNFYVRGNYFFLLVAVILLYFVGGQLFSIRQVKREQKKDNFLILFSPYPVLLASLLQMHVQYMEIRLVSFALTLLMIFLHVQNIHAHRDSLTSLYNRSIGEEYLKYLFQHKTKRKKRQIAGILIDIDGFKENNDKFGHDLGDRCLRCFAQLLMETFSRKWLVSRYGGDEFLLVREMTCANELDEELLNFKESLKSLNASGKLPFVLRVSVGEGITEDDSPSDSAAFLKILDECMYLNKRCYHTSLDEARLSKTSP